MGQDFFKKNQFFRFEISSPQASKQEETYFDRRNYLKTLEEMIIGTANSFLSHLQSVKVGEITVSKYGHLIPPGAFPDKVTHDIFYRWSSGSVWCSSCKNIFVGAGNLLIVRNKFWYKYLWHQGFMYYRFWT